MTSKTRRKQSKTASKRDKIEEFYLDLLHRFYEEEDRHEAEKVARRLEKALSNQPDVAHSIRGEEICSLLAELRGNLEEAIDCRKREIQKIRKLHKVTQGTPGWDYVLQKYDYSDLSDRLDLLATLYAEQGDLNQAKKILHESRKFCEAHGIPFDGQDLLEELEQSRRNDYMEIESIKTNKSEKTTKQTTNRTKAAPKKRRTTTSVALAQAVIPFQSVTITTPQGLDASPTEVLDPTFIANGVIAPQGSNGIAQVLNLDETASSDPIAFVAIGSDWMAGPFQQPGGGGNLIQGDYLLRARFPGNEDSHQIRIRIGSI